MTGRSPKDRWATQKSARASSALLSCLQQPMQSGVAHADLINVYSEMRFNYRFDDACEIPFLDGYR